MKEATPLEQLSRVCMPVAPAARGLTMPRPLRYKQAQPRPGDMGYFACHPGRARRNVRGSVF